MRADARTRDGDTETGTRRRGDVGTWDAGTGNTEHGGQKESSQDSNIAFVSRSPRPVSPAPVFSVRRLRRLGPDTDSLVADDQ